jgi:hypothetical protein
VLSDICHGILQDEARHLGFNQIYMEDRFRTLFDDNGDRGPSAGEALHQRADTVLELVPPMFNAVADELQEVGIDRAAVIERLRRDVHRRLDRSIERGRKLSRAGQAAAASP